MRRAVALGASLLAAALAVGSPAASRPTAENGVIAFIRYLREGTKLYTVDPATGREVLFPAGSDSQGTAAWSPDGRRIAFARTDADGTRSLVVTDARGRNAVQLTRHRQSKQVFDDALAWSPDGRLVAFQRTEFAEPFVNDLYVIGADGRGPRRLARNAFTLAWSPDGRTVAFGRTRPGQRHPDLYVVSSDGTGVRRLTRTPVLETAPSWSPDGMTIAFTRRRFNGDYDIFTMRADGTEPHRLTWLVADDYGAAWSPDGKKIVFASKRVRGQFDLFVMDPNGMNQRRLTRNPEDDTDPDWQPLPR